MSSALCCIQNMLLGGLYTKLDPKTTEIPNVNFVHMGFYGRWDTLLKRASVQWQHAGLYAGLLVGRERRVRGARLRVSARFLWTARALCAWRSVAYPPCTCVVVAWRLLLLMWCAPLAALSMS